MVKRMVARLTEGNMGPALNLVNQPITKAKISEIGIHLVRSQAKLSRNKVYDDHTKGDIWRMAVERNVIAIFKRKHQKNSQSSSESILKCFQLGIQFKGETGCGGKITCSSNKHTRFSNLPILPSVNYRKGDCFMRAVAYLSYSELVGLESRLVACHDYVSRYEMKILVQDIGYW